MSAGELPGESAYAPTLGTLAVDTERDVLGIVMGWDGELLTLRALVSGAEWQTRYFRLADANDELRARVAEANAAGRWGR